MRAGSAILNICCRITGSSITEGIQLLSRIGMQMRRGRDQNHAQHHCQSKNQPDGFSDKVVQNDFLLSFIVRSFRLQHLPQLWDDNL